MILYLDASALVKLYVHEAESDVVTASVRRSPFVATCRVAYVEVRAALARAAREKRIPRGDLRELTRALDQDWKGYVIVEVTEGLVRAAGELAARHGLRGYDALHLASALTLVEEGDLEVAFACYDVSLEGAARSEGLYLPHVA
ncbi:MAG: hypothetical protein BIP78_0059 [Candidatus Bipolaricaulis sibiricus]|uniref:Ribonuclease VapC n=1 Tax=Bipolaricaulis sibiricus TaxID=2501609 RepID=A0A410FS20_BIPS1|nr:MAG: hypothetical protein BIP78_0059 [Candidatus Bipolaricaulis sibiricus]